MGGAARRCLPRACARAEEGERATVKEKKTALTCNHREQRDLMMFWSADQISHFRTIILGTCAENKAWAETAGPQEQPALYVCVCVCVCACVRACACVLFYYVNNTCRADELKFVSLLSHTL